MLTSYVRVSELQGLLPTVGGFYNWVASHNNPNVQFCGVYVLQYMLGLQLFREGVRVRNAGSLHAGLAAVSPVFFILKMPFYQELYLRYKCMLVEAPRVVCGMVCDNVAFSENGQASKQQGKRENATWNS